jgi:hypothetical protein
MNITQGMLSVRSYYAALESWNVLLRKLAGPYLNPGLG